MAGQGAGMTRGNIYVAITKVRRVILTADLDTVVFRSSRKLGRLYIEPRTPLIRAKRRCLEIGRCLRERSVGPILKRQIWRARVQICIRSDFGSAQPTSTSCGSRCRVYIYVHHHHDRRVRSDAHASIHEGRTSSCGPPTDRFHAHLTAEGSGNPPQPLP